jgi:hypothetical protein
MITEKYYNIHNLLKFKIVSQRACLRPFEDINYFFSYFETKEFADEDILLRIGKFLPANQDCKIIDHKYYVKENYFYCKDQDGNITWEVEICGFERGKAVVNFHSYDRRIEQLLLPDYLAQNTILRPLIELKLLEKGYAVIHGLGLAGSKDSVLIAARGGAHKTRTIMDALRLKEVKLIGDDRLIIGEGAKVYSYPLFLRLVLFRMENLQSEKISVIRDRVSMIRYLSQGKNESVKKYVRDKSYFAKLIFVQRKEGYTACGEYVPKKITLNECCDRLTNSSKMEMFSSGLQSIGFVPFYKYIQAYSFIFPTSLIGNYWERYNRTLQAVLADADIFDLSVSEDYSPTLMQYYVKLIEGNNDE